MKSKLAITFGLFISLVLFQNCTSSFYQLMMFSERSHADLAFKPEFHDQRFDFAQYLGNGHAISWDGKVLIQTIQACKVVNSVKVCANPPEPGGNAYWKIRSFRPMNFKFTEDNKVDPSVLSQGHGFAMSRFVYNALPPALISLVGPRTRIIEIDSQLNALAIVPLNAQSITPYTSNEMGQSTASGLFKTYNMRVYTQSYQNPESNASGVTTKDLSYFGFLEIKVVVRDSDLPTSEIENVFITKQFTRIKDRDGNDIHGIEPTLTLDGRLMFFHQLSRLKYVFNETPNNPNTWSVPEDISTLYSRRNQIVKSTSGINAKFGDLYRIAQFPFRYSDGTLMGDYEIRGAYPWVNLDGDDLFFTTMGNKHSLNREVVSTRAGQSVMGASTRGLFRHIDGGINRDRYGSLRLLVASLGSIPGKWAPDNLTTIPLSPKPDTLPMFQSNTASYFEVSFYETLSQHFDFYLPMNEGLKAAPSPAYPRYLINDYDLSVTQDLSGFFHSGSVEQAMFSDDFLGPEPSIPANIPDKVNTYCRYECDSREDRYSGKAMYFPVGSRVTVPYISNTNHRLLDGSKAYTLMFAIKLKQAGGAHSVVKMNNIFQIKINSNQGIVGQFNNKELVTLVPSLNLEEWHHIALTYDGRPDGEIKVYKNGNLIKTLPNAGSLEGRSRANVEIGPFDSSGNGVIYALDQVALSPKKLNPVEISYEILNKPQPLNDGELLPGLKLRDIKHSGNISAPIVDLGRQLFFDKRLSGNGTASCAGCHNPNLYFVDQNSVALGLDGQLLSRNTPSIFNMRFYTTYFHDGRADSLEKVVEAVLNNQDEFAANFPMVANYVRTEPRYQQLFSAAGLPPTMESIFKAVAQFTNSLVAANSKHDQALTNMSILTSEELMGRELFRGKARCAECHYGSAFSDGRFHNIGIVNSNDLGLFNVTGVIADKFKFKTPSIRNVQRTAPYFHNGSAQTLLQVVALYNAGLKMNTGEVDAIIKPLGLNNVEVNALVKYLETLTGDSMSVEVPAPLPYKTQLVYQPGQWSMTPGEFVYFGKNNQFKFVYDNAGLLALYNLEQLLWSSGTAAKNCTVSSCRAVFQGDGNLVLYAGTQAYWHTITQGVGKKLIISGQYPHLSIKDTNEENVYPRPVSNILPPKRFEAGQVLFFGTNENPYLLRLNTDGNLVIYRNSIANTSAVWSSRTANKNLYCATGCFAAFQTDGNFVLYKYTDSSKSSSTAYWTTKTNGQGVTGAVLSVTSPYITFVDSAGTYKSDLLKGVLIP